MIEGRRGGVANSVEGRDDRGLKPVRRSGSVLRYVPALTVGLFLGPVIAGLLGTLLPAFGWLPVLGSDWFSLEPWRWLLAAPGLTAALRATLIICFLSTALALAH